MKKIFFLIIAGIFSHFLSGQEVSNISVTQRQDGSGKVDINYSLSGNENSYEIAAAYVKINDESNWQEIFDFIGDVSNIAPGDNLHIVWDAKNELPNIYSEFSKLQLSLHTLCNETLNYSFVQISPDDLIQLLEDDGINELIEGEYVYKLIINGGGGYYTHTEMAICLNNIIPISGIIKGVSDDSSVHRTQIGVDSNFNELFQFNSLDWVNVLNYTNSSELFFILDSMWGSNIDTWIYYWFGSNEPITQMGYVLLDEYNDDFGSISIYAYKIIN